MLAPGTTLGAYEILGPLGQGGMGEVYRARDVRLLREVALKVLAGARATDPTALARFESEARAASAINNPHIVAVYDVGQAEDLRFIVMELVEGRTLRDQLARGAMPPAAAFDLASQIAEGLAAAHGCGVVHRDLKPENVLIDVEGRIKIADFGLAKLKQPLFASPDAATLDDRAPAPEQLTDSGTLLGTVSYMSPEQAAGRRVDHRSDQFGFGVMLHEMLAGRRPFVRATPAETLTAIMRDEPEPLEIGNARAENAARWILARCLSKDPAERYESTRDLVHDVGRARLESTGEGQAIVPPLAQRPTRGRMRRRSFTATVALGSAGLGLIGAGLWARRHLRSVAKYERLTFQRGTVWNARFTSDDGSIVYSAAWDGEPFRLYRKGPHNPASLPLDVGEPAAVLSVSHRGEMAILVQPRVVLPGRLAGTLARVPLAGGAPRLILDDVSDADWGPDGDEMAVVRWEGGVCVLEYPQGNRLLESTGWLSEPRVSPGGTRVAVFDHPLPIHDMGVVRLIDTRGGQRELGGAWTSSHGMAWSPAGDELWVAASRGDGPNALYAVDLLAEVRPLERAPGTLTLLDTSPTGAALVTRQTRELRITVIAADDRSHDLSVLDSSLLADLSADGSTVLSTEIGEGGGQRHSVYLRRGLTARPLRLGDGMGVALSPDGAGALAVLPGVPSRLVIHPTGPGQTRPVEQPGVRYAHAASFFPDGRRLIVAGQAQGEPPHLYVHDLQRGEARKLNDAPVFIGHMQGFPVSPDGRWTAALSPDRVLILHSTTDGRQRPLEDAPSGAFPVRWEEGGGALLVTRLGDLPTLVERIDVETRERTAVREIAVDDPTGVHGVPCLRLSEDGTTCALTRARVLSELYALTGL